VSDEESRADEQSRVKVTDKRLFRPDGELREEYSFLKETEEAKPDAEGAGTAGREESEREERGEERGAEREEAAIETEAGKGEARPRQPGASQAEAGTPGPEPGVPTPGEPGTTFGGSGPGQPSFLDLVSVLAEPVAVYLGDVQLPDGKSAENLELARFHIDLLEVLKDKTAGTLSAQESSVLEELLYRLRMRYVQKRG